MKAHVHLASGYTVLWGRALLGARRQLFLLCLPSLVKRKNIRMCNVKSQTAQVRILPPPLPSCVTCVALGKRLKLSVPQFSLLHMRLIIALCYFEFLRSRHQDKDLSMSNLFQSSEKLGRGVGKWAREGRAARKGVLFSQWPLRLHRNHSQ